ncbi:MAG: NAD(+) synthase [Oligoflexales bacterium]
MTIVRIAGATVNQTPLDWSGNFSRIAGCIAAAKEQDVDLLCLPELCITGYNCEDMFHSIRVAEKAQFVVGQILPLTAGITISVGCPVLFENKMYNSTVIVHNGSVVGISPKKVLPNEGVHYESRWFRPWPFDQVATITFLGSPTKFGDICYQIGSLKIAVETCEEAWQRMPSQSLWNTLDADIVLNPSASHFGRGKFDTRRTIVKDHSRTYQACYVHTNLLGTENGRTIYDGGTIIGHNGTVVALGQRFSFKDWLLTTYDWDLKDTRHKKIRNNPDFIDKSKNYDSIANSLATESTPPRGSGATKKPLKSDSNYQDLSYNEEFLLAQTLALFDYLRKTGSLGYSVALSGGVDSSCCAVLVAQMVAITIQELGVAEYAKKLPSVPQTKSKEVREHIRSLLSVIYLDTEQNSEQTLDAAQSLALELNADFHLVSIQGIVDQYRALAEDMEKRPFTWAKDDLVLQNIQARARAPMAWMLANLRRHILITTSNRSEIAVGYATMDGDTAGGIAPLAGIDKAFLQKWLAWAEKQTKWGLGALKTLANVNQLSPSAELKPLDAQQTDEADLMPYKVLSTIERLFVFEKQGREDIVNLLSKEYPNIPEPTLRNYVAKFFKLFAANQWKREKFAMGFHVDEFNLDPRSWFRFPTLTKNLDQNW